MNAAYITEDELRNLYAPDLDLSAYSTATISGLISQASRMVDNFTSQPKGWEFETIANEQLSSDTQAHTDSDGNLYIKPQKAPVASVNDITAISIQLGGYTNPLTLSDTNNASILQLPYPGNTIIYPNTYLRIVGTLLGAQKLGSLRSYKYFVLLSYSAGYPAESFPVDIKQATALFIQSIVSRKYNPMGGTSSRQGSMAISFSSNGADTFKLAAESLLNDYKRVV